MLDKDQPAIMRGPLISGILRQFLEQQAVRSGRNLEELETRFMTITLNWTAEQSRLLRQTFKTEHYQNLHREWQHIERAWWLAVERGCYDLLESCWDILFYFEAIGTWGQGDAFFDLTWRQVPAEQRRMLARLDEAQALMAGRLYEMPRSVNLAQRSLDTLEE